MREKLIQYVELLFAGTSVYDEVRQEILQNTLDRYDDLVAEGKQPEAAYQLAIRGIGDVSEILHCDDPVTLTDKTTAPKEPEDSQKKLIRGIAITLYILCPVPLFIFQNEVGLCLLLVLVAAATGLLIWVGDDKEEERRRAHDHAHRQQSELEQSIGKLLGTVTLIIYLAVSFWTHAWYITWIIFPLSGAVRGLIAAIIDLKEAQKHEQ